MARPQIAYLSPCLSGPVGSSFVQCPPSDLMGTAFDSMGVLYDQVGTEGLLSFKGAHFNLFLTSFDMVDPSDP